MLKFGPIRGIKEVQAYLKTVPRGAVKAAIVAVTEYIISDSRHGLRHDDPYKRTTRKAVYGKTFESDKQRRYVMAKIRSGEIVPGQRKYVPTKASGGYVNTETRDGYTITNTQPGAFWSRVWAKWPKWRHVNKVVKDNMRGAMRAATSEVNKFLKSKGR